MRHLIRIITATASSVLVTGGVAVYLTLLPEIDAHLVYAGDPGRRDAELASPLPSVSAGHGATIIGEGEARAREAPFYRHWLAALVKPCHAAAAAASLAIPPSPADLANWDAHPESIRLGRPGPTGCPRIAPRVEGGTSATAPSLAARGRAYLAHETVYEARQFQYFARQGSRTVHMGETISAPRGREPAAMLWASVPYTGRMTLRLFRNGQMIRRASGPVLWCAVRTPGVYRVEASYGSYERPWIYSHPIVLK